MSNPWMNALFYPDPFLPISIHGKDNNHPARFYHKMEKKGKRETDPPVVPVYHPVRLDRDYLADKALDQFARSHSGIWRTFSALKKAQVLEEFRDTILSLEESLAINNPAFLIDHSRWAKIHFTALHYQKNHVSLVLDSLGEVLEKELPPDFRKQAGAFIAESRAVLKKTSTDLPSCITADNPQADAARSFLAALIAADQEQAGGVLEHAAGSGTPLRDIYLHIFQPVLQETGRLWQLNWITIAQEHFVTASVETFMVRLHNQVPAAGGREKGKRGSTVIAAGAGAELHDVGIRMVADFFLMAGWNTYYLGANTPVQSIIEAVQEQKAGLITLSATMPRYLPDVGYLIRALRGDPATAGVKIIVGGYPFRIVPGLWKQIGADAYAGDAEEGVVIARRLVKEPPLKHPRGEEKRGVSSS
jgi:MerR family transcriptional regulator, light-induced transcriptional regulator